MGGGAGVCSRIAQWAVDLNYEEIPRRVASEAKNQLLSVIASVHAGHFSDVGRLISRTVKDWGPGKDATLIPSGERASVRSAIFGNATLCMALAYDDHLVGAHTGSSAVLVTLALAEKLNCSGKDVLVAQTLANEIEGRIGLCAATDALSQYRTAFAHLIGSTLIAAKLRGLDVDQTESALGLALQCPVQTEAEGLMGSDAKLLFAAQFGPVGVQAAEMAACGLHAPVLEDAALFARLGASSPLPSLFAGLGQVWLSDTLAYNVYPCGVYASTALDATLALLRQHNIDGRKVRSIRVSAGPGAVAMQEQAAPHLCGAETLASTLCFSIPYLVAAALTDKELSPRQLTKDRIKDEAIWEIAAKVQVVLDEDAARDVEARSLARYLGQSGGDLSRLDTNNVRPGYGARVRIEMQNDRVFELHRDAPIGYGARTFDDRLKVVEDKFRRETRYTLRKERMERAIDTVHHLEDVNAVGFKELLRNCCSER